MKRCPKCYQSFTDDRLRFCPTDGSTLIETLISSFDSATIMTPPPSVTAEPSPPSSFNTNAGSPWNTPTNYAPPPAQRAPGGWQPPPPPMAMPGMAHIGSKQQTLALLSLIFGLLSLTIGLICGGPLFGVVAIVLGVIALLKIKSDPRRFGGKGLAIAGIIAGSLQMLLMVVWIIIMIISSVVR